MLLDASADASMVDEDGDTAGSFAAKNGHTDVVELINAYRSGQSKNEADDGKPDNNKPDNEESAEVQPAEKQLDEKQPDGSSE
jgi:ankyrin repeat protein